MRMSKRILTTFLLLLALFAMTASAAGISSSPAQTSLRGAQTTNVQNQQQQNSRHLQRTHLWVIGSGTETLTSFFQNTFGRLLNPWFRFWNGPQAGVESTPMPSFAPTPEPTRPPTVSTEEDIDSPTFAPTVSQSPSVSMEPSVSMAPSVSVAPTSEGGFTAIVGRNIADDDNDNTIIVIAASVAGIALLIALFFVKKKSRRVVSEAELEGSLDEKHKVFLTNFVGTGDDPKSFHEGSYHYTPKGARYLSTRCEPCLETRRGANQAYRKSLVVESQSMKTDDSNSLLGVISPDSKDIARRPLSQDVHHCTSATCERCANDEKNGINFIRYKIPKRQ